MQNDLSKIPRKSGGCSPPKHTKVEGDNLFFGFLGVTDFPRGRNGRRQAAWGLSADVIGPPTTAVSRRPRKSRRTTPISRRRTQVSARRSRNSVPPEPRKQSCPEPSLKNQGSKGQPKDNLGNILSYGRSHALLLQLFMVSGSRGCH